MADSENKEFKKGEEQNNDKLLTLEETNTKTTSIYHILPNLVTILAMCFGITAIKLSLVDQRFERAVLFIIIAGFLDGMDGRIARMLKASSNFGVQMDSFADFVSFGLAPAFTLYAWSLYALPIKGLAWFVTLFYAICIILRLARFNDSDSLSDDDKKLSLLYFFGLSSPAAAVMAITPIIISFEYKVKFFVEKPIYLAIYIICIALLTVSKIPTFSIKSIKFADKHRNIIMLLMAVFIVSFVINIWVFAPIYVLIYMLTIPLSYISFHKHKKKLLAIKINKNSK